MILRVAAYTGDRLTPSARFRVRQYLPALHRNGVAIDEFPSHVGAYPPVRKWQRPTWAVARLCEAVLNAPLSYRYDAVLFQRELFSTCVTAEPIYVRPRLLDVDDAIWLHKRGSFALKLARLCDSVICGNAYLANYFDAAARPIYVLPTAVDAQRFHPTYSKPTGEPIIGWSGTSGNLRFIHAIEPILAAVLKRVPDARLRIICDRPPQFHYLPAMRIDYVQWTPDVEVTALQDLAVGLMPLEDSAWARGKCAFKMLTYMACGVPVVVSPVGMNTEVLNKGSVGFGPRNADEWIDALSGLLEDRLEGQRMGQTARTVVEKNYSVEVLAPRFASILKRIGGVGDQGDKAGT